MTTPTFSMAGFDVNRIGFGAMQLPGPGVMGPPKDRDAALAVLRRAVELGVNHIDTAQIYGPDVANELIREALHPYPEGLALVSKVGARRDAEGNFVPTPHPDDLIADVEANLRSLGVEQLAAVNLRLMPEDPEHPSETAVSFESQLEAMESLRDAGKIAGIGLSTATPEQIRRAHDRVGLVCVQNAFSLLDQSDRPSLDYCADNGIAYVPYFPLGSAFPGMPKVVENPQVRATAERLGASPAQVGLSWLLHQDDCVLLIPGTSSVAHLEDNLAVGEVRLDEQALAELDSAVE